MFHWRSSHAIEMTHRLPNVELRQRLTWALTRGSRLISCRMLMLNEQGCNFFFFFLLACGIITFTCLISVGRNATAMTHHLHDVRLASETIAVSDMRFSLITFKCFISVGSNTIEMTHHSATDLVFDARFENNIVQNVNAKRAALQFP